MRHIMFQNKFVTSEVFLADVGERIHYSSPFLAKKLGSDELEVSPGYGTFWNKDKKTWEPTALPWTQGETLVVSELDLNAEENDPRKLPMTVKYFYVVEHNGIKYKFGSVYGWPESFWKK